jgi:hypothetical protein
MKQGAQIDNPPALGHLNHAAGKRSTLGKRRSKEERKEKGLLDAVPNFGIVLAVKMSSSRAPRLVSE